MIIDVTGIELTPGYFGLGCLGNGGHLNEYGESIECCCNECDYLECCGKEHDHRKCRTCHIAECPRASWEMFPEEEL